MNRKIILPNRTILSALTSCTIYSTDWNSINTNLIKENNQREITRLYNVLQGFYLKLFANDEELYNDFILKVVTSIDKYDHSCKFSTWIFIIGKNHFLQHKKTQARQKKHDELIYNAYLMMSEPSFSDDNKDELFELLSDLKPETREFILKYVENTKEFTDKRQLFYYHINQLKAKRNLN